jgi:hypothetical protein
MKIRLNNLRALKWKESDCNNNYKRNTFLLKQFKLYRMALKDMHVFFCFYWLYPLLLLAFMFIYIFWEWQVNEIKWGWGKSSLKTSYTKYNFPFIKIISNKNYRDISMPVCNRKLWKCKLLQNWYDALSGKTGQIYSTGYSFYHANLIRTYSPHASSERRNGLPLTYPET